MRENYSKREKLGLGPLASKQPKDLPGAKWDPHTQTYSNPGWTTLHHWLISLGIPIGNCFPERSFLIAKYKKQKKVLMSASASNISPIGKHKLVNANFYGMLRYYLNTIILPTDLIKAMCSDARQFIWTRYQDNMDINEIGSKGAMNKYISKQAENRPVKQGGAGILNSLVQPPYLSLWQHNGFLN